MNTVTTSLTTNQEDTMMKAGTDTGSLTNHLYSRMASPVPAVGMGVTMLMWTDRDAATIVRITPTQIHVQRDTAKRLGVIEMSEDQDYAYSPDPTAPISIFRKTKRGWKDNCGCGLLIGTRDHYHDYSF